MKTNRIVCPLLIGIAAFGLSSCNDFLDKNPDNRTTLDTEEKVVNMNVSAYITHNQFYFTELASDNCDSHGDKFTIDRFDEECYSWADITQNENAAPSYFWEGCYSAIASANQTIEACAKLPQTEKVKAALGEAFICRAFAHFELVNTFCQNYDPNFPNDLGVPYMEGPEAELNPRYKRGTVVDVYAKIARDIEAGLPLINDAIYKIPKYHFNKRAAYAFAAEFYLFYEKWDKAVEYATASLGNQPGGLLRDYIELQSFPFSNGQDLVNLSTYMIGTQHNSNLLLQTTYSDAGTLFGGYGGSTASFNHGQMVAHFETCGTFSKAPASPIGSFNEFTFKVEPGWWSNGLDKVLLPRSLARIFEMTDPVAQIGYIHAVQPRLTADLTLLVRAEAHIMQKNYPAALTDMNIWAKNMYSKYIEMTEASIQAWADKVAYYTPLAPTPKKALNPAFVVESGLQEAMIHSVLYLRRIETLHLGLRWFDVKRYGIEIYRRTLESTDNAIKSVDDTLIIRDNRRAIQLPNDIIAAGLEANPR